MGGREGDPKPEPCADASKPWHVVITRDADSNRAFYSGHDTQDEAEVVARDMNGRGADTQDDAVPAGFTYSVEPIGEFEPKPEPEPETPPVA